jgi:hypothetical protein
VSKKEKWSLYNHNSFMTPSSQFEIREREVVE